MAPKQLLNRPIGYENSVSPLEAAAALILRKKNRMDFFLKPTAEQAAVLRLTPLALQQALLHLQARGVLAFAPSGSGSEGQYVPTGAPNPSPLFLQPSKYRPSVRKPRMVDAATTHQANIERANLMVSQMTVLRIQGWYGEAPLSLPIQNLPAVLRIDLVIRALDKAGLAKLIRGKSLDLTMPVGLATLQTVEERIAWDIQRRLANGDIKDGVSDTNEALDSKELCSLYGLGNEVVLRALDQLVNVGYLKPLLRGRYELSTVGLTQITGQRGPSPKSPVGNRVLNASEAPSAQRSHVVEPLPDVAKQYRDLSVGKWLQDNFPRPGQRVTMAQIRHKFHDSSAMALRPVLNELVADGLITIDRKRFGVAMGKVEHLDLPLAEQVQHDLKRLMQRGELSEGREVTAESVAKWFRVQRATAVTALNNLSKDTKGADVDSHLDAVDSAQAPYLKKTRRQGGSWEIQPLLRGREDDLSTEVPIYEVPTENLLIREAGTVRVTSL